MGIGVDPRTAREPVPLDHPRPVHPLAHRRARLAAALVGQGAVLHRGDFEVDVDPVEQRSRDARSEEHTSELQSRENLVCRLLLEKKKSLRTYRWCVAGTPT